MKDAKERDSELVLVPLVPVVPKTKGARCSAATLFRHANGCSLERDEVPEVLLKQGIPLDIWVATFDAAHEQHAAALQVTQSNMRNLANACWVYCITMAVCGMMVWPFRNLDLQGLEIAVAVVFLPFWFLMVPLVVVGMYGRHESRRTGEVHARQEMKQSWNEFVERQERLYGRWGVKVGQVEVEMLPSGAIVPAILTSTVWLTRYVVGVLEFRVSEADTLVSTATIAHTSSNNDTSCRLVQDLQALFDLYGAGGLTEAEYSQAKVQLLTSSNTPQATGNESFIV